MRAQIIENVLFFDYEEQFFITVDSQIVRMPFALHADNTQCGGNVESCRNNFNLVSSSEELDAEDKSDHRF